MGPRSFRIRISGPKISLAPTKADLPYNFCFIKFIPSLTVAAVDALQTLFRAPPDPGGPPRGLKHSLWPGPCKVRPPYQILRGLVQRPGRSLDSDRQTDRQLDKYILDIAFWYSYGECLYTKCRYAESRGAQSPAWNLKKTFLWHVDSADFETCSLPTKILNKKSFFQDLKTWHEK